MITTGLINFGYYLLGLISQIFPISTGFPSEVGSAFTWLGGYVGMLDPLVPISTLGTTVGIAVSLELLILTFRIFTWIFSKIPIIGR